MESALSRLRRLQHELNDLFRRTFGPDPFGVDFDTERWERWMPPADLYRQGDEWIARIDLPEVNPEEVTLSIIDNHLVIQGERKPPGEYKIDEALLQECSYGPFERVITLPSPPPEDRLRTHYHQGVLYVTLPAPEAGGKRIDIQSDEPSDRRSRAA
ncbi:MAG: Hsp20/alpha crystallin family protein [Nitrospirae bacterium]|nr:Hsp20/alpha crystallin family protein [Candidatus Manganitrophaceae bacterium]